MRMNEKENERKKKDQFLPSRSSQQWQGNNCVSYKPTYLLLDLFEKHYVKSTRKALRG